MRWDNGPTVNRARLSTSPMTLCCLKSIKHIDRQDARKQPIARQAFPHLHLHLSLNRGGRWGTTDDFTTNAFWDLANSRPVQSLMLSSHDFFSVWLVYFPLSRWFWPDLMNERHVHITSVYVSLDGQIFMWSDCLLDLGTDFLVGNMLFVWDV